MKIKTLLERRAANRKRGFSMSDVMLGLIIVLVGTAVLYGVFTIAQRQNNKGTASRVASMAASEARLLFRNRANFTGINAETLVNAGAIPVDSVGGTAAAPTIILPFGGTLSYAVGSPDTNTFVATATWAENNGNSRSLCTYLSSGQVAATAPSITTNPIISGPMGSEYRLGAISCDATSPTFQVGYQRG